MLVSLLRSVLLSSWVLALASTATWANPEYRFERDARVSVDTLSKSKKVEVRTQRNGRTLISDASAVIPAPIEALRDVSIDYERYKKWGMPNLNDCRIVERRGQYPSVVWSDMESTGVTSRHYFEVFPQESFPGLQAFGLRWNLVEREPHWPFESAPAFETLEGSWYLETLPTGEIYARYFLKGTIRMAIPGFLIDLIAKRSFEGGVKKVVEILRREAQRKSAPFFLRWYYRG